MTRDEQWEERQRGRSLRSCLLELLRVVLKGDLGKAQRWHQFIHASFPKASIEDEFEKLNKTL